MEGGIMAVMFQFALILYKNMNGSQLMKPALEEVVIESAEATKEQALRVMKDRFEKSAAAAEGWRIFASSPVVRQWTLADFALRLQQDIVPVAPATRPVLRVV
jgi:hypothetical protein